MEVFEVFPGLVCLLCFLSFDFLSGAFWTSECRKWSILLFEVVPRCFEDRPKREMFDAVFGEFFWRRQMGKSTEIAPVNTPEVGLQSGQSPPSHRITWVGRPLLDRRTAELLAPTHLQVGDPRPESSEATEEARG